MPAGIGGTGKPGGGYYVINTGTSSKPRIVIDFADSNSAIEHRYPGKAIMGPWPSMQYAQAAAQYLADLYHVGVNIAKGAKAEANIVQGSGNAVGQTLTSGPFAGLGGVIQAIDTFFHALTDPYMWRSLAWLVLGGLLLVLGIGLWLKQATPIGKLL